MEDRFCYQLRQLADTHELIISTLSAEIEKLKVQVHQGRFISDGTDKTPLLAHKGPSGASKNDVNDYKRMSGQSAQPCCKDVSPALIHIQLPSGCLDEEADEVPQEGSWLEGLACDAITWETSNHPVQRWRRLYTKVESYWVQNMSTLHPCWHIDQHMSSIICKGMLSAAVTFKRVRSGVYSRSDSGGSNNTQNDSKSRGRRCLICPVVDPCWYPRLIWDALTLLFLCYDIIMFPLHIVGFVPEESASELNWLDLIIVVFWNLDIWATLSTGFYKLDGSVEMTRKIIALRYVKSWLLLDICISTIDWVRFVLDSDRRNYGRVLKIFRLLRVIRLARIVRLTPKVREFMEKVNSESVVTVLRLLSHLARLVIMNHYIACAVCGTWEQFSLERSESPLHSYAESLHWSLAHMTLGSMDIRPQNSFERFFTVVVLLVSMVLFSTFLSSITNAAMHLRALREKRRMQQVAVRKFFADYGISHELCSRAWSILWNTGLRSSSHSMESDVQAFNLLPRNMHLEIIQQAFLPHIVVHPLFNALSKFQSDAIKRLCEKLDHQFLPPFEELYGANQTAVTKMVFVMTGALVYQPLYAEMVIVVGPGEWACEEALWSRLAVLDGSLVAGRQGADILAIVPHDFQYIARSTVTSLSFILSYARTFIQFFNKASADENCEDILFNDRVTINNIVQEACPDIPALLCDKRPTRASRLSILSNFLGERLSESWSTERSYTGNRKSAVNETSKPVSETAEPTSSLNSFFSSKV